MGLLLTLPLSSQITSVIKPSIHTVQTITDQCWWGLPIIHLNSDEKINIDFDDFTHESMRYAYRIEHYSADWKLNTSLFDSDYIDGYSNGNLIEDYEKSINTNTLYTHYHFSIPNEMCRLKISGNYCVTVFDENDNNKPILRTYFMVTEDAAKIKMNATSNTDISINTSHQQLEADVRFNNIKIHDFKREINTYFIQNYRWNTAIINPTPQYILTDGLVWTHNSQLIFDGGNEYHKFEILDVNHANMGVERTEWKENEYHTYLWPNEPRTNYVYDEDANGAYFIRNSNNHDNNIQAEYQLVHFNLRANHLKGNLYINGNWTHDQLSPQYQLYWNDESSCYETAIKLKQGYYNFQYLWKTPTDDIKFIPTEGNFCQTENCYTILVYYRALGDRYDRLIGTANINTR